MFNIFKRIKKSNNIDRNDNNILATIDAQLNILSEETVDVVKFMELSRTMSNDLYAMMANN